jgi:hypothetical protein
MENFNFRNAPILPKRRHRQKYYISMVCGFDFIVGVLLIGVVIILIQLVVKPHRTGTITAKEYTPGYWFNKAISRNGRVTIVPIYQPQAWDIKIKTGDSTITRYVTQAAYDTLKINKVIIINK